MAGSPSAKYLPFSHGLADPMSLRFARFSAEKVTERTPEQGLCISSFLIARRDETVLLGKALRPEMAREKWILPASQLMYGEHPDEAARRILKDQLKTEAEKLSNRGLWSFLGAHWDLCFVYDVVLRGEPKASTEEDVKNYPEGYFYSSQLLGQLRYFKPEEIRRDQTGRGHDYVLEALGILKAGP